jgi:hypothetical protein
MSKENKDEEKKENNEENKLVVSETAIKKIEEEIKKQNTISKEKMQKIHKIIFENIIYAIVILIYFILLNIGAITIDKEIYLTDLSVFSMISIGITIFVFEYAYKKDSGKYAIHGIELLVVSILTLLSKQIYTTYNEKYINILTIISLLFAIYFVVKSTIIYVKRKKESINEKYDRLWKSKIRKKQ